MSVGSVGGDVGRVDGLGHRSQAEDTASGACGVARWPPKRRSMVEPDRPIDRARGPLVQSGCLVDACVRGGGCELRAGVGEEHAIKRTIHAIRLK